MSNQQPVKLSPRKLEEQLRDEVNDVWNLNQILRAENKRLRNEVAELSGYDNAEEMDAALKEKI